MPHPSSSCTFAAAFVALIAASFVRPHEARAGAGDDYVWVEGESPVESNAQHHVWYSEAVKKNMLSGGEFLSTFDGPAEVISKYEITIPKARVYTLWMRVNPIKSKVAWRVGEGLWTELDTTKGVDQVNVASDGKPDLRLLAWVNAGPVKLPEGKIEFEVKFHSELSHHGALDAFVFAAKPFFPSGNTRPDQKLGGADPGWWTFEPSQDDFGSEALLDLRSLNEKRAGERGPLAVKGDHFVFADGDPARFWAVNLSGVEDQGQADYLAKRLAKNGFNLARIHGPLFEEGGTVTQLDVRKLDRLHFTVKALADAGIYVHLSTYWPAWLPLKPGDGIEGGAVNKNPWALLCAEQKWQDKYKVWMKQILTSKNPYTGKTLATDPAVAFVEIQNEDSFFFWTFSLDSLGPGPWGRLQQRFAKWVDHRYGSRKLAKQAWKGDANKDDAADKLGLAGLWEVTAGYAQMGDGKKVRLRDQARFFAELQRDCYTGLAKYVKNDLGFKGLVTASNWITADNRRIGFLERWTYAGTDAIDRHGYLGGKHEGEAASWSIRAGHTYTDKMSVLDPADTPLGYFLYAGKPHLHTEIAWAKPNRYVADADLLIASYGALQGVTAWFLFATHGPAWLNEGSTKYQVMMPSVLGQSPAAALQLRRGDLTPAPVVFRESVTTDQLFNFDGAAVIEGSNSDFRVTEAPKVGEAVDPKNFDPLSYFVGRVERAVDDPSAKPEAMDLARFVDRGKKTVRSATGQLNWSWGDGLVTVNSPKSQAATGQLSKAGAVKLADVTIESKNEYGTIQVISLDDAPLATSKRILVQSFTEEKFSGSKASNGHIDDVGGPPIQVKEILGAVTFKNGAGFKAVALDGHGYKQAELKLSGNKLTLPKDALYVVLTR